MLSLLLGTARSFNKTDCSLFYGDSCEICVSHFADRQCGWCESTKKCVNVDDSSSCSSFYYGPEAVCSQPPPKTPTPAPTPKPAPTLLPGSECKLYNDCETCTSHFADRNCGWCMASGTTGTCYDGNSSPCDPDKFYYNVSVCGKPVPTPTPTPWPRYEADTQFCRKLSGTWCDKCVSTQPNMSCVWCHETKECAMGDAEGFFFGKCSKYSVTADDVCLGKASHKTIVTIRVVVSIFITAFTAIGIWICYKQIKRPAA